MVYFILAFKSFFVMFLFCFVFWSTQTKNVIACATRNWSFFCCCFLLIYPPPPTTPLPIHLCGNLTYLVWEPVLPWKKEYFCCGNLFCCGTRFAKGTYFATGTCLQKGPVSQPLLKVPVLLWKFVCFCYGINMTILLRREPDQFSL